MPPWKSPAKKRWVFLSVNRYRLYKYGIPVFLVFYLFMVGVGGTVGDRRVEVIPFFSWKLFSNTPSQWQRVDSAVIVHSIEGRPVAERYLVPNDNNLDRTVLRITVRKCRYHFDECNEIVRRHLYPIVNRQAQSNNVEFSIVTVSVDLREVQKNIDNLSRGETKVDDYYRRVNVLGRWTTGAGNSGTNFFQFPPPGDERWKDITSYVDKSKPIINAYFDVYLYERALIYVRRACRSSDLANRFFLHTWPVDEGLRDGFENLDFKFMDVYFRMVGEECMVVRSLPQYTVDRIRTGQFKSGRVVWEGAADFTNPQK